MPRDATKSRPDARFDAPPMTTQPQPDPAPVAGLTVALTLAMVERVRSASAVQVRKDALDLIEDWNILNLANAKLRDENAALRAELAAVAAALPDPEYLESVAFAAVMVDDDQRLRRYAARIRALPSAGGGAGADRSAGA